MQNPPGPTAILLIAHGSRQRSANDDLHELAERLAEQGTYPIVEASFLELAEPALIAGGDRCAELGEEGCADDPLLPVGRRHLRRDLTAARDELSRRVPGSRFASAHRWGRIPCSTNLLRNGSVSLILITANSMLETAGCNRH